jgi:hypothetical protein
MLHVRVSYVVVIASMCLITKDTWSRSGAEPARAGMTPAPRQPRPDLATQLRSQLRISLVITYLSFSMLDSRSASAGEIL